MADFGVGLQPIDGNLIAFSQTKYKNISGTGRAFEVTSFASYVQVPIDTSFYQSQNAYLEPSQEYPLLQNFVPIINLGNGCYMGAFMQGDTVIVQGIRRDRSGALQFASVSGAAIQNVHSPIVTGETIDTLYLFPVLENEENGTNTPYFWLGALQNNFIYAFDGSIFTPPKQYIFDSKVYAGNDIQVGPIETNGNHTYQPLSRCPVPKNFTTGETVTEQDLIETNPISDDTDIEEDVVTGSDPIPPSPDPNLDLIQSGIVTLYNPTAQQMGQLANYLWSTSILTNLSKTWVDPMQLIISVGMIPCTPTTGGSPMVWLGPIDTNVFMRKITKQWTTIECGSVRIPRRYGSHLDYSPNTKASIYIPFVGVRPLKIEDIMGATLTLSYKVDVATGAFSARVLVSRGNLSSVLYHFAGNCMTQIPLSNLSMSTYYQSLMQTASSGISALTSGNPANALISGASAMMAQKENVTRSGALSGSSGLLDNMESYIILESPNRSRCENYNGYFGIPCNVTAKLSSVSGFTKISSLVKNTLNCTKEEQTEIISLLKEGVIL